MNVIGRVFALHSQLVKFKAVVVSFHPHYFLVHRQERTYDNINNATTQIRIVVRLYRYPTHMSSTYGRDFARYYESRYYEVSVYI